jgi:hypothetical protein
MNVRQFEGLIVWLIFLAFAFAIWVILYHPEWLLLLFTSRG